MQIKLQIKRRNRQRGQGMVEFALAFPVFLLIIIGIFEFGRLFITYTSVYAAAREGARFGAAAENIPTCGAGVISNAKRAGFLAENLNVTHVYDSGPGSGTKGCGVNGANISIGDRIVVTVESPFHFVTGLIPTPGGSITLRSIAKRTIIQNVYISTTPPSP